MIAKLVQSRVVTKIVHFSEFAGKSPFFPGWWFGCHEFYFPRNIGNVIIPIDGPYFSEGWVYNHQPVSIVGKSSHCMGQGAKARRFLWPVGWWLAGWCRMAEWSQLLSGWWMIFTEPYIYIYIHIHLYTYIYIYIYIYINIYIYNGQMMVGWLLPDGLGSCGVSQHVWDIPTFFFEFEIIYPYLITFRRVPPAYVCWFINPMNHIVWCYLRITNQSSSYYFHR